MRNVPHSRKSFAPASASKSRRKARSEWSRGQITVLVAVFAIGMFAIIGLAVDVGRLFAAKAELSRAVDAAALAGVLEFPNTDSANTKALAFLTENEPTAIPAIAADAIDNKLTVNASKPVQMYFLSVLGITSATVSAHAVAGFGIAPVDAYMALDATGSMANSCNASQNNSGCKSSRRRTPPRASSTPF